MRIFECNIISSSTLSRHCLCSSWNQIHRSWSTAGPYVAAVSTLNSASKSSGTHWRLSLRYISRSFIFTPDPLTLQLGMWISKYIWFVVVVVVVVVQSTIHSLPYDIMWGIVWRVCISESFFLCWAATVVGRVSVVLGPLVLPCWTSTTGCCFFVSVSGSKLFQHKGSCMPPLWSLVELCFSFQACSVSSSCSSSQSSASALQSWT